MRPGWMCAVFVLVLSFSVGAENTIRKRLKVLPPTDNAENVVMPAADTIVPDTSMIYISGYDKPLSARQESFFLTNRYQRTILSITVTLRYYDMSGHMLHSALHKVKCDIPAGETRMLYVPSWDKQFSFYYYQSVRPRRQSTPYRVTCSVQSVVLEKN